MKLPGKKPKIWRGYRNCSRCTRWRPVSDFPIRRTRTGFEQIEAVCNACKKEVASDYYNSLPPEEKQEKFEAINRREKKRKAKALSEIEHLHKMLDKQNEKIVRQQEKLTAIRKQYRPPRGTINGSAVDVTPFRMWLLRKHRETGYNLSELATSVGQDESRVKRWLDGYQWNGAGRDPLPIRAIDVGTVDAIGVAMDDTGLLERLYPLEADE